MGNEFRVLIKLSEFKRMYSLVVFVCNCSQDIIMRKYSKVRCICYAYIRSQMYMFNSTLILDECNKLRIVGSLGFIVIFLISEPQACEDVHLSF